MSEVGLAYERLEAACRQVLATADPTMRIMMQPIIEALRALDE